MVHIFKKKYMSLHPFPSSINHAFTLAEILITLGIIGIVASITIPALIQNIQDQQFKEAAKAAYSKASQAVTQMRQDYGTLASFYTTTNSFKPIYMTYFKVIQDCGWANCVPADASSTIYKSLSGDAANATMGGNGQFVTLDGTFINIANSTWNNSIFIMVDINGYGKDPNMYGKDTFFFELKNDNLLPAGSTFGTAPYSSPSSYCVRSTHSALQGITCMSKVLQGVSY